MGTINEGSACIYSLQMPFNKPKIKPSLSRSTVFKAFDEAFSSAVHPFVMSHRGSDTSIQVSDDPSFHADTDDFNLTELSRMWGVTNTHTRTQTPTHAHTMGVVWSLSRPVII